MHANRSNSTESTLAAFRAETAVASRARQQHIHPPLISPPLTPRQTPPDPDRPMPTFRTAPDAQKPSLSVSLGGFVLAGIAVWMAWDGLANGVLDMDVRGLDLHLELASNPLGFWAGEAVVIGFGLAFALAGVLSLLPQRPAR